MATLPDTKTDYEAEVRTLVRSQYRYYIALQDWIRTFSGQFQATEQFLQDIDAAFDIDTATGEQLDILGRIAGIERGGRSDSVYRTLLLAQFSINRASGTPNDLLNLIEPLYGDPPTVTYRESYPAEIVLDVATEVPAAIDVASVNTTLQSVKPGGVRLHYVYRPQPDDETFAFAPGASLVAGDSDQGLANTGQTTGGRLAGVYAT